MSVSPLTRLEAVVLMLMTSADNRLAANSKLVRVRVEGSMNRLTSVLPRSDGTFLMVRSPTCLNAVAVSSRNVISSGVSSWIPSKSLWRHVVFICPATPHLCRQFPQDEPAHAH